ncbi:MAG: hypothetical protein L0Y76_09340, partial [Ignavibacteria bacterium]|nr:hypothetical protein [Ignavibacteria bacterium]
MEPLKKIIKQYTDLLSLIQFTGQVSSKIYGLEDDDAIFKTVFREFAVLKQYDCSIMLLSDDESKLIYYGSSVSSDLIKSAEKKAKIHSKKFEFPLEKSPTYTAVVKQGKTVYCRTYDLLAELVPRPVAFIASKVFGPKRQISTATPLIKHGKIIGAFGMNSPKMT